MDQNFSFTMHEGLTYKEAALKLNISVNTVKTYQKRIFQLLNVRNKAELVKLMNK